MGMMRRKFFFMSFVAPAVLLPALLLSACGGGGGGGDKPVSEGPPLVLEPLQPAAALAAGLEMVEVTGPSGQIEVQQRFTVDVASGEEQVLTTAAAGNDGVWGTADDWRAGITRCQYTAGAAVDERLLLSGFFQPEALLEPSVQACFWRHPAAGEVRVSIKGVATANAQTLNAVLGSPTGEILFGVLGFKAYLDAGDLIGITALLSQTTGVQAVTEQSLRFGFSSAGLLSCPSGCEEIAVPASIPADSSCNINCTGLDNIVYNPYAGLDITGMTPPSGVHIYNGIRFFPVYAEHRLQRLVQSIALNNPLAFPLQYEEFHYSAGQLVSIDTLTAKGADGLWFTADDVLSSYFTQQATADGWQRVYYTTSGVDGVWKTGDDLVGKVVILHRDTQDRIASVQVCDGAGPDTVWQTADDVCRTLTFHYAADAS